ncbi:uncharacterized protein LOC112349494 isoform X2 [Selaginella moellendorffii]|uniref:uncharacterized protein LOC112349494 isoform X2 n=1 Tax=Selaginella moellendorffii TaxID=88036 RepID=UPI000D1CE031|nr:uncharacterized protein LOC112349494 isoform X2 [Selaginella moellendorffii]|eukprot:XP_024539779.1 uncharacterized protein LOC112349494 isoform X2 [Selaginella moellendorffii]
MEEERHDSIALAQHDMDRSDLPKALGEGDGEEGATTAERDGDPVSEINKSRAELLARVQNLKKDLQDWRGKLDSQVKNYREELGELRSTLNSEVEQLRSEFQDLRNSLNKQLNVQDEGAHNGGSGSASIPPPPPE